MRKSIFIALLMCAAPLFATSRITLQNAGGSGVASLDGAILDQSTLQSGATAYPDYLFVGSTAVIFRELTVGNEESSSGSYYKFPASVSWPHLTLGSNDPVGSQSYSIDFVLQGNNQMTVGSSLLTGFEVTLSSSSSLLPPVSRMSINRTSGEFVYLDHSGNRMLGIMPSSSTQQVPAIFVSSAEVNGLLTSRSTATFTTAINVSSSSFMDSRYNVYTASGIPYPVWSLQRMNLPYAQSGLIGQLQNFKTIKAMNTAITGGVGVSGVKYLQELDRLFMVDNNSLAMFVTDMFGVRVGSITLNGFTDPESADIVGVMRDSSGTINSVLFGVSEEQSNQIKLFVWPSTATTHIVTSANTLIISPTNMPTPSATVGQEAICWDEKRLGWHTFKQDTPFDYRFVPYDGTITPAAEERWDAETLYSALMPAMNDCDYDPVTDSILIVGDQTSSSSANQDLLMVNPDTGARKDYWDNFPTGLNLDVSVFAQSEGVAISWPNIWITSEGNEFIWIQLDNGIHGLPNGNVVASSATIGLGAELTVAASSITTAMIVRGFASQTVPIVEVKDSGGRNVVTVSSEGFISTQIGTTTTRGRVPSVFDVKFNSVSNLAATETELYSSTFTAGTFFKGGDCVNVYVSGTFGAGVSADKRIRVYFGATTVLDSGALAATSDEWDIRGTVCRTAAAVQKSIFTFNATAIAGAPDYTTPTQTMSANILFRVTGAGTNAGDSVGELYKIVYEPNPGQ